MSNLKKFEETLGNLDLEVNRLKAVSQAYAKLENLIKSNEIILVKFKENNTEFIRIREAHSKHLEEIQNNFKKIDKTIHHAGQDLNSAIDEKSELIRKDNKEFYRDLESTLKIKLEDNKSQIKQLIESERVQIKQIIENENLHIKKMVENTAKQSEENLIKALNIHSEIHSKKIKILTWLSWSKVSITLAILIILVLNFYLKV